jgi:hypothetical protein
LKINILLKHESIEGLQKLIEDYFESKVRIIREELSIYETYRIYPVKKYISKLWNYRVINKNGFFNFGELMAE